MYLWWLLIIRQTAVIDEVAAATASISETTEENPLNSVTLEHCAEQILSGIKREVEVQYLLPMAVQDGCDLESNPPVNQNEQTCDDKDTGKWKKKNILNNLSHYFCVYNSKINSSIIYWFILTIERDCWNVLADFLNPVAKEVVAEECGLIGESYLVTDLNPTALGLNIVEPEIITPDHLFGEELSFQFYELASPSQLQSAWQSEKNRIRLIFVDGTKLQNVEIINEQPIITMTDECNSTSSTSPSNFLTMHDAIAEESVAKCS